MIEWVKNRSKSDSQIFYQHNPENVNLFVVLNIASLVPQGKVILDSSSESWTKVAQEAAKLGITNIKSFK